MIRRDNAAYRNIMLEHQTSKRMDALEDWTELLNKPNERSSRPSS